MPRLTSSLDRVPRRHTKSWHFGRSLVKLAAVSPIMPKLLVAAHPGWLYRALLASRASSVGRPGHQSDARPPPDRELDLPFQCNQ